MPEQTTSNDLWRPARLNGLRHVYGDLKQRLDFIDPRPRWFASTRPVRVDKLVILVGLKRSGLHATANWLLGLQPEARLVNNSPMKHLGWSSPMSRTRNDSPLPVNLYSGIDAIALDSMGYERSAKLREQESLLVVLFQSQHLAHLADHPVLHGVKAAQTNIILQLRDPFNWSSSYKAKSNEADDNQQWLQLWREYAREFSGTSHYLPTAIRLNFNHWLGKHSYREELAFRLGLPFADNHRQAVSSHAGGSSFDQTRFNGNAGMMRLDSRWHHYREDIQYLDCLRANADVVRLGLELFELPGDLRAFAQGLLVK